MKSDQFLGTLKLRPFRPFAVLTASGERYEVRRPENSAISRSGRTVAVFLRNEELAFIDTASITGVVASPSRRKKAANDETRAS